MTKIHSDLSYIVKERRSLPKKYKKILADEPKYKGWATIKGKSDTNTITLNIHEGESSRGFPYDPGNDIYISVERRLEDPANNRLFNLTIGTSRLSDEQYTYLQIVDLNGDGAFDVVMKLSGKKKHLLLMSHIDESQPMGLGVVPKPRRWRHYTNVYSNNEETDRSCGIIYGRNYYASYEELPEEAADAYKRANIPLTEDDFNDYLDLFFPYRFFVYRGEARVDGYLPKQANEEISLTLSRYKDAIRFVSDHTFDRESGVRINKGRDLDFIVDTVDTPEETRGHHVFESEKPVWIKKKKGVCLVDQTAPLPKGLGSGMIWDFSTVEPEKPPYLIEERRRR